MTNTGVHAVNSPSLPSLPSLPYPATASRRKPSTHRKAPDAGFNFLVTRARTTNLAVLILATVAALSLLVNIRLWLGADVFRRPSERIQARIPHSIRATLQSPHSSLQHLVMVPGHAIFTGCDASHATSDNDWILEPYQRGGSVRTFIKHITKAAEVAVQDPEALLIYSGGQTRANADSTEGTSYARLAKAGNIYQQFQARDGSPSASLVVPEFARVTTEDYALDSMENLLFSIARFKEFVGHYPSRITVVGFGMKRQRFEDVHRAALRWPQLQFKYIGIDNEVGTSDAYSGERTSGLEPFMKDSYGCKGGLLAKRRQRNPYRRFHPYHNSAPELAGLLEYCPKGNEMFNGRLPWD